MAPASHGSQFQLHGKVKMAWKRYEMTYLGTSFFKKGNLFSTTHPLQRSHLELWGTSCHQHVCHQETWLPWFLLQVCQTLRLMVTKNSTRLFTELFHICKETFKKHRKFDSPIKKTGMKAPQGTGMVVATADIQNWNKWGRNHIKSRKILHIFKTDHTSSTFMMMKRMSVMKTLTWGCFQAWWWPM